MKHASETAHGSSTLSPKSQVLSPSSHVGHVVPLPVLFAVWAVLMVLTVVTVAVTHFDLGAFNLWIALAIAAVKASFVLLYFMHLRYDHPFNAVVFITALLFVALFVGLALMDSLEYQPQIEQLQQAQTPA